MSKKRIAIIADWLIDFGGAELVISHLLEMYPEADIYTSVCYMDHPMLKGRKVYTSWIQKIPFLNRKHKLAGLLRPWAFRSFDLSGYDLIICSSSAESKQVAMGKWNCTRHPDEGRIQDRNIGTLDSSLRSEGRIQGPKVVVYCHTPIRYYWSHAKEYEDMMEFGILNPIVKFVFPLVRNWMKRLDFEAAQKVDFFIANSKTTAERIKLYYNRDAEVIYPGVNEGSTPALVENKNGKYYLGLGRCIPYKRFDILVEAFNTNGKKLILCTATDTKLYHELKEKSKPNIEWKFRVSNEEKNELMANAQAFLFPPEEDFGLVPVEAMSQGTPVIAYGKGGATESIIEGVSGIFFLPQSAGALNTAIEKFESMSWEREKIQTEAQKFGKDIFQKHIASFVEKIGGNTFLK